MRRSVSSSCNAALSRRLLLLRDPQPTGAADCRRRGPPQSGFVKTVDRFCACVRARTFALLEATRCAELSFNRPDCHVDGWPTMATRSPSCLAAVAINKTHYSNEGRYEFGRLHVRGYALESDAFVTRRPTDGPAYRAWSMPTVSARAPRLLPLKSAPPSSTGRDPSRHDRPAGTKSLTKIPGTCGRELVIGRSTLVRR